MRRYHSIQRHNAHDALFRLRNSKLIRFLVHEGRLPTLLLEKDEPSLQTAPNFQFPRMNQIQNAGPNVLPSASEESRSERNLLQIALNDILDWDRNNAKRVAFDLDKVSSGILA